MREFRGFTLIELLIVVAIIAILAAIAVPNFLEAQTRAKVSRVLADMRSLTTALESYRVDNNRYHPSLDPTTLSTWSPRVRGYAFLTTPVAYITSAFPDPFNTMEPPPMGYSETDQHLIIYWGPDFLVTAPNGFDFRPRTAHLFSDFPGVSDGMSVLKDLNWVLVSYSPDQDFDVLDAAANTTGMDGTLSFIQAYDPTNGTVSDGDVLRLGTNEQYPAR